MVRVARTIRYHLVGILNAKIQKVKRMACGYRNRARFHNAILFHLGGLDLQPHATATHTRS